MIVPFEFKGKKDGGEYWGIASTPALDRDGEVLLPRGCDTRNFDKNPVMLMIHNYRAVPVGKVTEVKINDKDIEFSFKWADTELGKELESLYNKDYMNAFSVGFVPHKSVSPVQEGEKSITSMEIETFNGYKYTIDLSKYPRLPEKIYSHWELLEISPVPVPSNPEALIRREIDGIVRKSVTMNPALKSFISSSAAEDLDNLISHLKHTQSKYDEYKMSSVVQYEASEVKDLEWSGPAAKVELARWASSDSSGEKSTIDWNKFAKGFGFIDVENIENFGSYRFPHHCVSVSSESPDKLVTVWRGLTSSMASVLNSELKEQKELYDHLALHYRDAGKSAPEYKTYSETELKTIAQEEFIEKSVKTEPLSIDNGMGLDAKLEDVKTEILLRLSVIGDTIELMNSKVQKLLVQSEDIKAPVIEVQSPEKGNDIEEINSLLDSFLKTQSQGGN